MRLKCPKCGERIDASDVASGERVECGNCHARLRRPASDSPTEDALPVSDFPTTVDHIPVPSPHSIAARPAYPIPAQFAYPPPAQGAQFIPVPVPYTPPELVHEQVEDLREGRDHRRERRRYANDDRWSNTNGITSFAMSATAAILAVSGFLFQKELPCYAYMGLAFGLPASIGALASGLFGVFRPGQSKVLALIGVFISASLLLIVFPVMMIEIKRANGW